MYRYIHLSNKYFETEGVLYNETDVLEVPKKEKKNVRSSIWWTITLLVDYKHMV